MSVDASLAGASRRDRLLRVFETALRSTYAANRDVPAEFRTQRHAIVRALLPETLRHVLYRYAVARAASGTMIGDAACPGAPLSQAYDPVMEELLHRLTPWIERLAGCPLHPTYAYFRVYRTADALPKHCDRAACEISVTLNLGYVAREAWPIFLRGAGDPVAVRLEPGDALLYRGIELLHWREPFEGEQCAQVFLHYVAQDGPHAHRRYNGRERLNRLAGGQ
jgi:hypothetical protein